MKTLKPYFQLLRIVNLPTVPGDVLVGAAAVLLPASALKSLAAVPQPLAIMAAALAGVFLYLLGLVDNDIVGSATDRDRPIPRGEISLFAARVLRAILLVAAVAVAWGAGLPKSWWLNAAELLAAIAIYNRTKWPLAMGLCRALNVLGGAFALGYGLSWQAGAVALVALVYIAAVTRYSRGEELDAEKRRRVGALVGGVIYLQLAALLVFPIRPLLITGALLLVALRILKRTLPEVSAS